MIFLFFFQYFLGCGKTPRIIKRFREDQMMAMGSAMGSALPPKVRQFLNRARVGHLATADAQGRPSVVPICFVHSHPQLYSLIDNKPKEAGMGGLKRIRNLKENPQAAVIVDRWDEDWSRIGWVLLRGLAEVIKPCPEGAMRLLRGKYPQYRDASLDGHPAIRMTIASFRAWGNLSLPPPGQGPPVVDNP